MVRVEQHGMYLVCNNLLNQKKDGKCMTNPQGTLSKVETRTLITTVIIAAILWFGLLVLPWIAVNSNWFELKSEDEVKRVQSVLQQLGTYGDLFGALNCLFSGAALIGVVYAVILQRHDLHHQRTTAEETRGAVDLQNRVTLYQYLADYHRSEECNAGKDILLAARSKGRWRAYAELMAGLLKNLEKMAAGEEANKAQTVDYCDHPARISFLWQQYRDDESEASDPSNPFGPIQDQLLSLVEEIAAITVLNSGNAEAADALLEAGHAVNAAIRPQDLLEPEQLNDAEFHRTYQIKQARNAFNACLQALKVLGATTDVNGGSAE
jgi:hypothetical protein